MTHLEARFPRFCAQLQPGMLASSVDDGLRGARACGIQTERGLCKFVEVAVMLAFEVPDDELHAWATSTLQSEDLDPSAKIDHVHDVVLSRALAAN